MRETPPWTRGGRQPWQAVPHPASCCKTCRQANDYAHDDNGNAIVERAVLDEKEARDKDSAAAWHMQDFRCGRAVAINLMPVQNNKHDDADDETYKL